MTPSTRPPESQDRSHTPPSTPPKDGRRTVLVLLLVLALCWVGWSSTGCGPDNGEKASEEPVERFSLPDTGPEPQPDTPSEGTPPETPQETTQETPELPPKEEVPLPPGTWPTSAGGASSDFGKQIAIDGKGNIYVTGDFEGTMTLGAHSVTAQGGADVFIAKLDPTGKFLWAVSGGSQGYDGATGIAVDASGQVYVTGKIEGDATFGETTLTSIGFTDIFIASIKTDGTWAWAKVAGAFNVDSGEAITVAPNGDILVTGNFRASAKFGTKTLKAGPNDNLFVARLDNAGNWKWATARNDEKSAAPAYAIGTDAKGNAYITGYYVGEASFGSTALAPSGGFDTYVAKINADGTWAWATPGAIPGPDSGRGIAVNADGTAVIIGRFEGSGKIGATDVAAKGKKDVFVAKIAADGGFLWTKTYGSDSFDFARSIAADSKGNVFASSTFQSAISVGGQTFNAGQKDNVLIVKLSPTGDIMWAKEGGGAGFEAGFGITATPGGVPFVTGYFQEKATFDGGELTSKGLDDVFIWRVKVP